MNLDPQNWSPLSVSELAQVFAGLAVPWWIAGGWALDLFVGRTTRLHEDSDVAILRRDQLAVQSYLSDWQLFKTKQPIPPHLAPWPSGEFLDPSIHDIWARRNLHEGSWRFQLMLMEADGDCWIYRRLPSISGKITDLGLSTDSGIPYLAPEVQLLYKSKTGRPKDLADFLTVLPMLTRSRAEWLRRSLEAQYPAGHSWVAHIRELFG